MSSGPAPRVLWNTCLLGIVWTVSPSRMTFAQCLLSSLGWTPRTRSGGQSQHFLCCSLFLPYAKVTGSLTEWGGGGQQLPAVAGNVGVASGIAVTQGPAAQPAALPLSCQDQKAGVWVGEGLLGLGFCFSRELYLGLVHGQSQLFDYVISKKQEDQDDF